MHNSVIKVLKKIEEHGFEAYAVGGYPRDLLMGVKSIDVDICTNATPKDLKIIFSNLTLSPERYGSVRLFFNKTHFDITTFRKENKYIDYRTPSKVEYISELLPDLKRRDFIINTLCLDSNGEIIDLMNARKDLQSKIIQMIGHPKKRLKEDVLRILRAIRFATILNFNLEDNLYKYIVKYGYLLSNLSYERKKQELDKIFISANVKYGIDLLINTGLDKHLELSNMRNLKITSTVIGIWAQLDVAGIYNFNKNDLKTINMINELMKHDVITDYDIYKYGAYISSIVAEIKEIDRKNIIARYNSLYIKSRKEIAITNGEIITVLNRKPGNYIKEIYKDIEEKIINKVLTNDYEVLKKYILENWLHILEDEKVN